MAAAGRAEKNQSGAGAWATLGWLRFFFGASARFSRNFRGFFTRACFRTATLFLRRREERDFADRGTKKDTETNDKQPSSNGPAHLGSIVPHERLESKPTENVDATSSRVFRK